MRFYRKANPAISAFGTVFLAAALLAAMYLTPHERHWMEFLAGVLAAAVLALVSRSANARWIITRRTAQLRVARAKLASQTALCAHAQEALARMRGGVKFIDEELPAMLAYLDCEGRIRYHNRAYTRWAGLPSGSIDGKRVEEIVGPVVYSEIEGHLREALEGHDVSYERKQAGADGEQCRLHVQYLPNHDGTGAVVGVFAILTDITSAADLPPQAAAPAAIPPSSEILRTALARGDFSLYCQAIAPLGHAPSDTPFYEVQMRMNEEEIEHLPPGAFFGLAEEAGLLPEIDRWTAERVVDFAAEASEPATYVLRISAQTLESTAGFVEMVRDRLAARGLDGRALCFELGEDDVMRDPIASRRFLQSLRGLGCRIAISGFGRNPVSLQFLQELEADFLKLDAGIVLNMLRSTEGLARVKEINKAAHAAGMRTVADCVENPCTRAALARLETDFAQGTGIAQSRLMQGAGDPAQALAA